MPVVFRVGVTPDFYVDARGRFEAALEQKFAGIANLEWVPMPPQPGNVATPEALNQFDALFALALRISAASLRGVTRLAVVARWGVGYDMLDTDALTQGGIALAITPDAVRRPVAEAILALILALGTNLMGQDRIVRAGKWRGALPRLGRGVLGRTLGSVGCGNIAGEMFRLAGALGFGRRIAFDPWVSAEQAAMLGVELVSLGQVFAESDYVTVNVPLNESTRGLIGAELLRQMKPTAYFLNTARGPIVRERDLFVALQEGWIAGAGLDVFEQEPLPMESPLRSLENVILAPHALAWTEETARDNGLQACDNILTIARGEIPTHLVNREVVRNPAFQAKLAAFRGERGGGAQ